MRSRRPISRRTNPVALLEGGHAALALGLVAEDAHEHAGQAEVVRDLDARDGDEAEPRVLQLGGHDARDLLADALGQALRTASHHSTSMCWSTRRASRGVRRLGGDRRERLLQVDLVRVDAHDGDRGPLPQVLVLDFGQRHVVPVAHALLEAAQRLPLVLERPRAGKVQLESQKPDDHVASLGRTRAIGEAKGHELRPGEAPESKQGTRGARGAERRIPPRGGLEGRSPSRTRKEAAGPLADRAPVLGTIVVSSRARAGPALDV